MKITIKFDYLNNLSLIFITLKLCEVISWNWFCVLSPVLLSLGIYIAFIIWRFHYLAHR